MIKVAIGCDHGGYDLKEEIKNAYASQIEWIDCGCFGHESVDYPDFAIPTAEKVAANEASFGIVICKSGIGVSIAANKVKGIRCALIDNVTNAMLCHAHNNANVIAMGSNTVDLSLAKEMIDAYMLTAFEERHQKRIDKISAYENKK